MTAPLPQQLRDVALALQRGHAEEARARCAEIVQRQPASADAFNLLGLAEAARGDHRAARTALERAVALQPRYANAWHNLATVAREQGDARAAVRAALRALDIAGGAYTDWYNLGVQAFRAGMVATAGTCFERALAKKPDDEAALNNVVVARDAEHRPYDAQALAERLVAAHPSSTGARHTFAAVFSKATEPASLARGLEAALAVLASDPAHAGAHDCAAVVLGKQGQRAAAEQHAREAVRLDPARADYAHTLANLLDERDALDEAAAVLDAANARGAPSVAARRLAGRVALRRGRPADALAAFDAALALDPGDQAALAQRALALERAGDSAGARTALGLDRYLRSVRLAVPLAFRDAAEFHAALAHDIRHHSRLRYEPVGLAARGGYLTEDLLADRTPAILGFEQALRAALDAYIAAVRHSPPHPFASAAPRAYRLNLWATRVAAGGSIDTHIHDASWLSGAYYVELPPGLGAGGDDTAGWIEFGRPHRGLPDADPAAIRVVRPEVGTLVLFPSYVYHRTLPFAGDGERISISFDLAATDGD